MLKGITSDKNRISRIACEAAQKLILHNLLPQEASAEIVKTFVGAYFDPDGDNNAAVRQGLSYFLPVFCHSKIKNAQIMAGVIVGVIPKLINFRDELEEEDDHQMVGWPVITAHLSEWTDGRKVVGQTELGLDGKMSSKPESELPHISLAIDILERALSSSCSKDERKVLLSLLSKLHIPSSPPKPTHGAPDHTEPIESLHALVAEAIEAHLAADATQRNTLIKLDTALAKRRGDAANPPVQDSRDQTSAPESPAPVDPAGAAPGGMDVDRPDRLNDDDDEEDDSLLEGLHAEGTRMPLEAEGESDSGEESEADVTPRRARDAGAKTEMDIMDELLASDTDMDL